jgi:tetratricopeptide (TPR) repeat protein
MAYYYQIKNDLANEYFQKSLEVNQTTLFIKAKCLYYLAFLEHEKGNVTERFELLKESLEIFQSIDAQQGPAWIFAWQGQLFLQKGDFITAQNKFSQALALFRSISDTQGSSLVNSLIGLMFYQQGKLEQAEEILEEAFDSSVKIGNPVILSYCFLPLVFLYIESKTRSKAQECIYKYQELCKTTSNEVVKLHGSLAEAIFLKSSSRFIDKGLAQQKFLKLLEDAYSENYPQNAVIFPTSDKDFSFLVVYHLIELYIEEFKLTEDKKIMLEAQQLIDNHIHRVHDQKISPKYVELSLLKAKLLIVDGEIEKALVILERVKQDAITNSFHRLEEKVGIEITLIEREFQKWDAAISVRDRIEKVKIEEYLNEAQQMVSLHRQ